MKKKQLNKAIEREERAEVNGRDLLEEEEIQGTYLV